jgi:hypothetical protein
MMMEIGTALGADAGSMLKHRVTFQQLEFGGHRAYRLNGRGQYMTISTKTKKISGRSGTVRRGFLSLLRMRVH